MNRKASFLTMVALAAGTLLGAVSGCELLAPVDRSKIDGSGGSGGAPIGGGGSSSTTSPTTGGGGSGGSGGCKDATTCPAPAGECKVATCDAATGMCGEADAADGADAKTQTAGDCTKNVCTAGAVTMEEDEADPFDDDNECTTDSCVAGMPASAPTEIGSTCTKDGTVCDGASNCVECNGDADCKDAANPSCSNHECIPVTCNDGVKNGSETDKDCGGPCNACADDLACKVKEDCLSGVCTGLICQVPTCSDGVKNGLGPKAEGDVDCGGMCPNKCGPTLGCNGDSDCVGNQCSGAMNGTCIPNCADKVKNNAETDEDCGGGTCTGCGVGKECDSSDANCIAAAFCNMMSKCTADKPLGQGCQGAGQCLSGNCTDTVCCNSACNGVCSSCNLAATAGTCTFIAIGQDPANECNGNGGSDVCDGNAGCAKATGTACAAGAECASNSCVDGVCCESGCSGTCKACTMAKTGMPNGTCANVTMNTDPDTECLGVLSCTGNGTCAAPQLNGGACTMAGECDSGICADGFCCNNACGGACRSCAVAGALGACTLHAAGTDPENECNDATPNCNGSGICAP